MERMVWTAMIEFSAEIHHLWLLQYRSRESLLQHRKRKWSSRSIADDRSQRAVRHGHLSDFLDASGIGFCLGSSEYNARGLMR